MLDERAVERLAIELVRVLGEIGDRVARCDVQHDRDVAETRVHVHDQDGVLRFRRDRGGEIRGDRRLAWVLGWGGAARVLTPPDFIDRVRAQVRRPNDLYPA